MSIGWSSAAHCICYFHTDRSCAIKYVGSIPTYFSFAIKLVVQDVYDMLVFYVYLILSCLLVGCFIYHILRLSCAKPMSFCYLFCMA